MDTGYCLDFLLEFRGGERRLEVFSVENGYWVMFGYFVFSASMVEVRKENKRREYVQGIE